MATKLVQKHFFKGTRVFEVTDDAVSVRVKSPFNKEESLTVMLTVLNPEPVVTRSLLEFTSRVNNEPLLSLFLAKPNPQEFNAFVNLIRQKAQAEYNAFAGLKAGTPSELGGNVYEEPPEFDPSPRTAAVEKAKRVSPEGVENAIRMLSEHIGREQIAPFIASLEALRDDPRNESNLSRMIDEFDALGPNQGAVLTYAPYVVILLSDDPFRNF